MVNFEKQFDNILEKYQEIENNLNNQGNYNSEKLIKLNKEYAELKPIVETINNFKKYKTDIADLSILLNDKDNMIKEMAEDELKDKKKKIKILENDLLKLLIPKDVNDKKNYNNNVFISYYYFVWQKRQSNDRWQASRKQIL